MSQRQRASEVPMPPTEELRAQQHGERHRIQAELRQVAHQVSAGVEPEDVDEPGAEWKPYHHHDAEIAKEKVVNRKRRLRHWKTKMWKRRSAMRQAKANAFRVADGERR